MRKFDNQLVQDYLEAKSFKKEQVAQGREILS